MAVLLLTLPPAPNCGLKMLPSRMLICVALPLPAGRRIANASASGSGHLGQEADTGGHAAYRESANDNLLIVGRCPVRARVLV